MKGGTITNSFCCSDHGFSLTKIPTSLKIVVLSFLSLSLFFFAKRFSFDFATVAETFVSSQTAAVSDVAGKIPPTAAPAVAVAVAVLSPARRRPGEAVERTGIIDENGAMTDDFVVGEFDEELIESVVKDESGDGKRLESDENRGVLKGEIGIFSVCNESMTNFVPCLDYANSSRREGILERHCPEKGKGLDCVVPRPTDYKLRIPWPKSRDEIWFSNVPHTPFAKDEGGDNWVTQKEDKWIFPEDGTQSVHGAQQYLDQISKMVPEIAFGQRTRVAMDIGGGVASFGACMMSRNVSTLSIAPKDVHENKMQFALERGVPAMLASFATHRLLYPSQAFDLIHCSRCSVNWTSDDGVLLLEVNRFLRSGGYFIWAAEPVYRHGENSSEPWKEMEDLTRRLCWELLKKEGDIFIWRKPLNNSCYVSRGPAAQPSLCDVGDDPDNLWNVNLKKCITRLPENGYGANVTTWPARLHSPPDRLFTIKMDAELSRKEIYKAESRFWYDIVSGYVGAFHWKELNLRNVMDMRASYGGFAAALHDFNIDCWVMNVVPVSGYNTLPVIYDRGLIGVAHDWCVPFDTYPRTYDLINAAGLFSVETKRCNITSIMLEMDRILRPGGRVYIRDTAPIIDELEGIARALGWVPFKFETGEGPHSHWKLLNSEKRM